MRLFPFFRRAALAAVLATAFLAGPLGAETLRVYTASQPELLTLYKKAFEARHPDVEITFLRDSASPIVARLLAERNAPQADVVHALSVIGLETLAAAGVLTPYRPQDEKALDPRFLSKESLWVGINAWGSAICLNEELLERQNLPVPKHWTDLTDPVYRGKIAMPHPVSSSTGYMILLGWLELFGEEKTWDFVKALHENMLFYTFSGSRPVSMVAQGEIAVGLSSNAFTKPYRNPKIPLRVVEPEEGIGWDAEGSAVVAGTKHPEAAQAFLDFCAGEEVARIAADFSGIAAREDFSTQEGRKTLERMIPMNFQNAALRKNEILQKWQEVVGERLGHDKDTIMSHTLHLRDLMKRFGSTVAISPLTLSFPGGRFTSLLGPSGCGKSTLLRLITGLERPSGGRIFVDDTEITEVPPVHRKIGMVFQQYALFPNLTVAENVLYGLHGKDASGAPLWPTEARRERMREMLALVGLESFAERRPHELSGGQQQRVAIARALAPNPSILLLDEPLSALDAWSRTAIGEELREIQRKSGVTTLMVTHDRTEALTLSDYVAVLHDGKLEDFGTPDELYEHPKSAFSATFVGDMNLLTLPTSNGTVGIRYADVKLSEPTEQTISAPESYVGKVQRLEFRGDMLRAHVLLNDFKTTVTADVVRVEHPWLHEGALLVVRLPEARWCRW